MDNFKTESEILLRYGVALIVENAGNLADSIKKFISDKKFFEGTEHNALKAVKSQNGTVSFTIKESLDS
jgi:hypothetical protein